MDSPTLAKIYDVWRPNLSPEEEFDVLFSFFQSNYSDILTEARSRTNTFHMPLPSTISLREATKRLLIISDHILFTPAAPPADEIKKLIKDYGWQSYGVKTTS